MPIYCPGSSIAEREIIDYDDQVFDNTPAAKDGTIEAGDELVGINGTNVKVGNNIDIE